MPLGPGRSRSLTSRPGPGSTRPSPASTASTTSRPTCTPTRSGIAERVAARGRSEQACPASSSTRCCTPTTPRCRTTCARRRPRAVVRAHLPGATVLRPAAYHQNLVDAARAGRLTVPYSLDAPFTNVDLDDVAEVAATVLTRPGHEGADPRPRRARGALGARPGARRGGRARAARPGRSASTLAEWVGRTGRDPAEPRPATTCWRCSRPTTASGLVGDAGALRRLLGRDAALVGGGCSRLRSRSTDRRNPETSGRSRARRAPGTESSTRTTSASLAGAGDPQPAPPPPVRC